MNTLWTPTEDELVVSLVGEHGPRWARIAILMSGMGFWRTPKGIYKHWKRRGHADMAPRIEHDEECATDLGFGAVFEDDVPVPTDASVVDVASVDAMDLTRME